MREVLVRSDGIRLGQLLKLAELVETGSEGKELLAAGGVEVNGEVELRRGRQMHDGDEVRARDQAIRVVLLPD
ncbi:MAG: RNA-binding S4 domain-containing protein [Mycobacteriales bacterium]